jgi:hypothetical protein
MAHFFGNPDLMKKMKIADIPGASGCLATIFRKWVREVMTAVNGVFLNLHQVCSFL